MTCDELDVGALGEQRVVLDPRPDRGEVDRLGVGDDEDAVRVAHADRARGAVEGQRVEVDRPGERHLVPGELAAAPC